MIWYIIYLTAIGLTPGGSSTVHIYTQTIHEQHNGHKTIHRTTQLMQEQHNLCENYNRFDMGYELFLLIQCPCLTDLLLIKCFPERRSLCIDAALTSRPYWWPDQVGSVWPCEWRLHSHQCSRYLSALSALRTSHSFVPTNSDTILSESVMWKREHFHHPATGCLPFSKCILFQFTRNSALTGKYKIQSEWRDWRAGGSLLPKPLIVE